MIIGYFDYIVIGFLIFLNIRFWKKKTEMKTGCILGGVFFGFILPLISMIIELQRVKMTIGIIDNFEVLYTYLRFPSYWGIGIIQAIVVSVKRNNIKVGREDEIDQIGNDEDNKPAEVD
ncbi:hypothetical protein [Seonamhaeicola sp. ML3]|uniref:hypothetical protein n=1 Tax=Seonamhaeicola sp. ML3 TaxID=2937786 RepID=UPI002010430D|nr:hypothetical protein [Seonamhaeicola sp. ML3]